MILTPFLLASVAAATQAADVAPTAPVEEAATGFFRGWTGNWNVGINYTDGNTDVTSASVGIDAERQVEENRWTASAYWNYTETDGFRSQRNAGGQLKHDHFIDEGTYLWVDATAMTDEFAMVDLRWTIGGGTGYQFIDMGVDADGDKITKAGEIDNLRGELGLTYFNEEFDDGTDTDYIALRAMGEIGMDLTETTRLENTTTLFPSLEDSDDIYGRSDTRVRMNISDTMFAQVQWVVNYDNTPAAGADRTDNRIIAGLGWSF